MPFTRQHVARASVAHFDLYRRSVLLVTHSTHNLVSHQRRIGLPAREGIFHCEIRHNSKYDKIGRNCYSVVLGFKRELFLYSVARKVLALTHHL